MAKFIIEYALLFFVGLLIITQVLIPAFLPNLDMWWLFKKAAKPEPPATPAPGSVDELNKEVDDTVQQYNETKEKVDQLDQKVKSIKDKIK